MPGNDTAMRPTGYRKKKRRKIHEAHRQNSREKIAQQLAHLGRIGGNDIQKHVDSDNRAAVEKQQHYLKGSEHHERENGQYRHTNFTGT